VTVPVVTIDGPSGSGKGTVAARLAQQLGWHCLDSGALYRLTGLAAQRAGVALGDAPALGALARNLAVEFRGEAVYLDGIEVSRELRSEATAAAASQVAALGAVREALLAWQRDYAQPPGLVADGRDMGTVVFPQALLTVFLDASVEERANRRYKQLIEKGITAILSDLVEELRVRDERDRSRPLAPLQAAPGALVIDSTGLTIAQVVQQIREALEQRLSGAG